MEELMINPVLLRGSWRDINRIWLRATDLEFVLNYVQTTET